MKRTTEYILLVIGAVFSLIGIVLAFITKSVSNTAQFKMEFEQQIQNNPELQNEISSDQLSSVMSSFTNYALIVLIISIVLAIVALVFVKNREFYLVYQLYLVVLFQYLSLTSFHSLY